MFFCKNCNNLPEACGASGALVGHHSLMRSKPLADFVDSNLSCSGSCSNLRLRKCVWRQHELNAQTKCSMYRYGGGEKGKVTIPERGFLGCQASFPPRFTIGLVFIRTYEFKNVYLLSRLFHRQFKAEKVCPGWWRFS